jgi:hypothetical protein
MLATGVRFNLETLNTNSGKREKKVLSATATLPATDNVKIDQTNTNAVGWQYRYRVSKMLAAQKQQPKERLSKSNSKKVDQIPADERIDPVLARLTPEQRIVGWAYR